MKTIICDTRQKSDKNDYITKQLEDLGYRVVRSKLYAGDYTWATDQRICIDTKADLQEVVGNVTQQHKRFQAECERAKAAGIKLIILIREPSIKTLEDVPAWFNWRTKVSPRATTGRQLYRIMLTMKEKYGVDWRFATPQNMGQAIVDILEKKG